MTSRLSQLLAFLEKEPNDTFLQYAVAMEYLKTETEKSVEILEKIANQNPNYTPTYYQLAALYWAKNEIEKAKNTYLKGIEICKIVADHHTLRELQRAYQHFLDEVEN
jgi:tetratricopeptide (TPR) repeat protein